METIYVRETIQSLFLLKKLHEYEMLDQLKDLGAKKLEECMMYDYYFQLFEIVCDYLWYGFNEDTEVNKFYFSFKDMTEFYALCRTYCCRHGVKFKNNLYVKQAQSAVCDAMNFNDYGCAWEMSTKSNTKWASGIILETDCYFRSDEALLIGLLEIRDWYATAVIHLRKVLSDEEQRSEVLAA